MPLSRASSPDPGGEVAANVRCGIGLLRRPAPSLADCVKVTGATRPMIAAGGANVAFAQERPAEVTEPLITFQAGLPRA